MAFKMNSPFKAYIDNEGQSRMRLESVRSQYSVDPKKMITADGVTNSLNQDDKEKELSNPFSGYNLEKGEIKPNKKSEKDTTKKDLKQKKKQAKSDLKFYKKTGIDLSEDESPVNFLGQVGLMGAAKGIAQGIKNRDEYGGGLKGAAKATIGNFTGQTEKQRFDNINEKLDSISQAVGVSQDQTEPIDNTIETGQDQNQVEAQSPMMMKSMKKKVLAKTGTGKAHNMSAAQYRQEGLMSRLSGNDERLSTEQLNAVENLDFINDMSPMNYTQDFSAERRNMMGNLKEEAIKAAKSMSGSPAMQKIDPPKKQVEETGRTKRKGELKQFRRYRDIKQEERIKETLKPKGYDLPGGTPKLKRKGKLIEQKEIGVGGKYMRKKKSLKKEKVPKMESRKAKPIHQTTPDKKVEKVKYPQRKQKLKVKDVVTNIKLGINEIRQLNERKRNS